MSRVTSVSSPEAEFVRRLLWGLAGLTVVLAAAGATAAGLRFARVGDFLPAFAGLLAALALARLYLRWRGLDDERFQLGIDIAATFALCALGDAVLEYAAATTPAPDATALIQAADRAVGFSWFDYAHFVSGVEALWRPLRFCYGNWMIEMFAVMALLAARRRYAAIGEFALAFTLACFAAIATFALMDSHSLEAAAAYRLPGFHHPGGATPVALAGLEALRAGATRTLDFGDIWPLIAFPSMHTATAVLLAAASRELGPWRLPAFGFNVVIVVSTINEGGHNLADVLAGIGVALASIAAAGALYPALRRLRAPEALARVRHFPVDIPLAAER